MSGFSPPDSYTTPIFTNNGGYMVYSSPSQRLWGPVHPNQWGLADPHQGTVYIQESIDVPGQFNATMKTVPTYPPFQSSTTVAPAPLSPPLVSWGLPGVISPTISSTTSSSVNPSHQTPPLPTSAIAPQTVTGLAAGRLPTTTTSVHQRRLSKGSSNTMPSSLFTRLHELPLDKQGILMRTPTSTTTSSPSASAGALLFYRTPLFEAMLSLMEFCTEAERRRTTAEPDGVLTDRLLQRLNRYT
ncbi:hypothetical protein FRC17_002236, partial [Serendipita sp. 399]